MKKLATAILRTTRSLIMATTRVLPILLSGLIRDIAESRLSKKSLFCRRADDTLPSFGDADAR